MFSAKIVQYMNFFEPPFSKKPFIKVCGVSNSSDLNHCVKSGVNAFGMILQKKNQPSKVGSDRISIETARQLANIGRQKIHSVLLVHSIDAGDILDLIAKISPSALQLQGNIQSSELYKIKKLHPELSLIKTVRITSDSIDAISELEIVIREYLLNKLVDGIVLDSKVGGSGLTHNWEISGTLIRNFRDMPFLLAGGLNASNVRNALDEVKPFGVDVMSALNGSSRNVKDHRKIDEFVSFVRY